MRRRGGVRRGRGRGRRRRLVVFILAVLIVVVRSGGGRGGGGRGRGLIILIIAVLIVVVVITAGAQDLRRSGGGRRRGGRGHCGGDRRGDDGSNLVSGVALRRAVLLDRLRSLFDMSDVIDGGGLTEMDPHQQRVAARVEEGLAVLTLAVESEVPGVVRRVVLICCSE